MKRSRADRIADRERSRRLLESIVRVPLTEEEKEASRARRKRVARVRQQKLSTLLRRLARGAR